MKPVTIPLKDRAEFKYRLLMSLGKGRKQAITGKELAQIFSHKNDRQVRLIIRELIEEGYPIASTTGQPPGFFIAETKEEVLKYASGLRGRLIEDAIRRRNFLRASRQILQPEQLKLEV